MSPTATNAPPVCANSPQSPISLSDERFISRKAKQLTGRHGFTTSDTPDIQQQLRLKLLRALPSFDPRLGDRPVFVKAVIERAVASIVRAQRAEKRRYNRVCSLNCTNARPRDADVATADALDARQADCRLQITRRTCTESKDLALDVGDMLKLLPPNLRNLAEGLMVSESDTALASDLGIPRTTLIAHKRKLRERFEQTSLRQYL